MIDFVLHTEGGGSLQCLAEDGKAATAKKFNDEDGVRSFESLQKDMLRHRTILLLEPTAPMNLQDLQLAGHDLGDRACRSLVQALVRGTAHVETIELYKNRLGDASAQALAQLVGLAPKPGILGLHLSHNYFTPIGVSFIMAAAASSGNYPIAKGEHWAPLWLRVEHQKAHWPAFDGYKEQGSKFDRAKRLIEDKEEHLLRRAWACGKIPEKKRPEGLRMICMPGMGSIVDGDRLDADGEPLRMPKTKSSKHSGCQKGVCCHACEYGPIIHLPYFWAQHAREGRTPNPQAALLHLEDSYWKTWKPRVPIARQGAFMALAELEGDGSHKATAKNPMLTNVVAKTQKKEKKDKTDKKEKKSKSGNATSDSETEHSASGSCPVGHALTAFTTYHASFSCDVCGKVLPQGARMQSCRICDWDACGVCKPKVAAAKHAAWPALEDEEGAPPAQEEPAAKEAWPEFEEEEDQLPPAPPACPPAVATAWAAGSGDGVAADPHAAAMAEIKAEIKRRVAAAKAEEEQPAAAAATPGEVQTAPRPGRGRALGLGGQHRGTAAAATVKLELEDSLADLVPGLALGLLRLPRNKAKATPSPKAGRASAARATGAAAGAAFGAAAGAAAGSAAGAESGRGRGRPPVAKRKMSESSPLAAELAELEKIMEASSSPTLPLASVGSPPSGETTAAAASGGFAFAKRLRSAPMVGDGASKSMTAMDLD